jgi:multimeric flavodoxin WrbA
MSRQILAVVGSPRPHGTSASLARYLTDALAARGWETHTLQACRAVRDEACWAELEQRFLAADVIVISTALYADSLPAELTLALERLAAVCASRPAAPAQRLLAIVQCGFIESHQNDVAVDICRLFARQAGIDWAGGLAFGGGGMVDGADMAAAGARCPHLRHALDLAVAAVDAGTDLPPEALAAARRRPLPVWLYAFMANLSMLREARKRGVLRRLNAQPYRRR